MGIGGPALVGVIVASVITVATYETPCACTGAPVEGALWSRVTVYQEKLATFDRAHAEPTCPSSIGQLDGVPASDLPGPLPRAAKDTTGWTDEPFALECTIGGAPPKRTVYVRHPGWDRTLDTYDDKLFALARP